MLGNQRLPRGQLGLFVMAILVLGFLFTIQVRSQATAEKLLSGQDNVSLGLLITGLAQSNQRLTETRLDLAQEVQKLEADVSSNRPGVPALHEELTQLQVLDGTVPVHGPGISMQVAFTMQAFELQDLTNGLRQLGAEALEVNGRRLTATTVVGSKDGILTVDGQPVDAPYEFRAIGDISKLSSGARSIVGTLKAHGDVTLQTLADVHITSVVPARPTIYSSFGS